MAQLKIEKLMKDLDEVSGLTSDQKDDIIGKVKANIEPKTYDKAVLFLGGVAVLLSLGAIVLIILGKMVPDAFWGVVGASIGGLAGVLTGK